MIRRVGMAKVREGVAPELVQSWEQAAIAIPSEVSVVTRVCVGRDLNPQKNWDIMWALEYKDAAAVKTYVESRYHVGTLIGKHQVDGKHIFGQVQVLYYDTDAAISKGTSAHLVNPIRRTLFIKVREGTPQERVTEMEQALTEMPTRIKAVKNWYFARAIAPTGPTAWTHVWEHEFADDAGAEEYRVDHFHHDVVGPNFSEGPRKIADFAIAWQRPAVTFIGP